MVDTLVQGSTLLFSEREIRYIAKINPRLAFLLECMDPPMRPQIYPMETEFPHGTEGETHVATLNRPFQNDAWIQDVLYEIELPSAYVGAMGKPWYDEHFKKNPYLWGDFEILGTAPSESYRISQTPVPIGSFANPVGGGFPTATVMLRYQTIDEGQSLRCTLNLRRALDGDEIPLRVTLLVNVWEVDSCYLKGVDMEHAIRELRKCGVLPQAKR